MNNIYHVLNGDALSERFPSEIRGTKIIVRECLVDGPIHGDNLDTFYQIRSEYLDKTYHLEDDENYRKFVIPELKKLNSISDESEVNLWFEEDLFCQVNLWFVCNRIVEIAPNAQVYFLGADTDLKWGFAGMNDTQLIKAITNRKNISTELLKHLSDLWIAFQHKDSDKIKTIGSNLKHTLWVQNGIELAVAEIEQQSSKALIRAIMEEIGSENFGAVFKEFHHRGAAFGYGDLMVKRIFDEINSKN